MAQTVIGFFDNRNDAERAAEQLASAGISRDRVDVSLCRNSGDTTGTMYKGNDHDRDFGSGITRFFKSLFGGNDDEASRYHHVASNSECMVTVHALSQKEAQRAADLLDACGAVDIDERSSNYRAASNLGSDYSRTSDRTNISEREMSAQAGRLEGSQERSGSDPIIREKLDVDNQTEERGGVKGRSRIIERPVEEHVRLREEHVRVERNPVDRPLRGDEMGAFREGEIELTERAEIPVVNKEARVVEEVRLSKEVTEHDDGVGDTVRNMDAGADNGDRTGRTEDTNNINLSGGNLLRDGDLRDDTGYQDLHDTDYRKTDNDMRDNLRDNSNRSL